MNAKWKTPKIQGSLIHRIIDGNGCKTQKKQLQGWSIRRFIDLRQTLGGIWEFQLDNVFENILESLLGNLLDTGIYNVSLIKHY